jgi:histidinol-phosphatase (PHP family)
MHPPNHTIRANNHTHTLYSDGNSQPEEYVVRAIELGFSLLGFSEHSLLPFENTFSFKLEKKEEYLALFDRLKSKYKGQIELALAMEFDYIPGLSKDFKPVQEEFNLDYSIGSVHLVGRNGMENLWFIDGPRSEIYDSGLETYFGGDIRKAVGAYYSQLNAMLESQQFDIIGHLDKIKMHNRGRYFTEEESWYKELVMETLELIRQKGVIIEMNTRGIYKKRSDTTYPGPFILRQANQMAIPVTINSDAHLPEELDGEFALALSIAREAGIKELVTFEDHQWKYNTLL